MPKIHGVIIDPFKREVRNVHDDFNEPGVVQQYLGQGERGPKRAPFCAGPRLDHDTHSYVDDDGCFREGQAWSAMSGYDCPLAGYVLILGSTYDGAEASLRPGIDWVGLVGHITHPMTPEEAQAAFPPVTVSSLDPETGAMKLVSSHPVDFGCVIPMPEVVS